MHLQVEEQRTTCREKRPPRLALDEQEMESQKERDEQKAYRIGTEDAQSHGEW
jgi:hypothetical protein